jgi:hypothetical protein
VSSSCLPRYSSDGDSFPEREIICLIGVQSVSIDGLPQKRNTNYMGIVTPSGNAKAVVVSSRDTRDDSVRIHAEKTLGPNACCGIVYASSVEGSTVARFNRSIVLGVAVGQLNVRVARRD